MRNFNPAMKRIEAFIGAWGVKTSEIANSDHLLELAARLFEIENNGVEDQMADRIAALGKQERKRLAQKNIEAVFGANPREQTVMPVSSNVSPEALQRMMDQSKPKMIAGAPFDCVGELDIDPAQLLRKVVSAVISAGRADILWEFPEVLAFFGSRIPNREEVDGHTGIDERMFEAADLWRNRDHRDGRRITPCTTFKNVAISGLTASCAILADSDGQGLRIEVGRAGVDRLAHLCALVIRDYSTQQGSEEPSQKS